MLDGAPIVAVLTGLKKASNNSKTGGALYQTWILRRDVNPIAATHSGDDASICGGGDDGCRHRGIIIMVRKSKKYPQGRKNVKRSCYVRLDTAPLNVWRSFHRGIYPHLPLNAAREFMAHAVRGGSYGDPAAVPIHVWEALLHDTPSGTAYTHQWRRFPELAAFAMASCDSEQERVEAKLLGFRTFRVRKPDEPIFAREVACPASKEMQHKTTCDLCKACGGQRAKAKADIVIMAHGPQFKVNAFLQQGVME